MTRESVISKDASTADVLQGCGSNESTLASGKYVVTCYDKDGNFKWEDTIENLVTTIGKNDALDKYLAGSTYTATWYIGLIGSTSYTTGANVADTMSSHGGWVEDQSYSQGARPTTAWSAAGSGSKALSAALAFTMNAGVTIKGCFLTSVATKGGTTGTLYSAGVFTGGDKVLQSADTLNVSYTATLT